MDNERTMFAAKMRAIRILLGYSQDHFAMIIGVPFGTYGGWEGAGKLPRTDNYSLHATFDLPAYILRRDIPLNGPRFCRMYDEGKINDIAKSEEALELALPKLLPTASYRIKMGMGDHRLAEGRPDYLYMFGDILVGVPAVYLTLIERLYPGIKTLQVEIDHSLDDLSVYDFLIPQLAAILGDPDIYAQQLGLYTMMLNKTHLGTDGLHYIFKKYCSNPREAATEYVQRCLSASNAKQNDSVEKNIIYALSC